jgi:SAM-dependent methyltransferase
VTSLDWSSYDEVADLYEAISVPHYFRAPAERLVLLMGLSCGDALLDVGAGTGVVAAAARRTAATVLATDRSLAMLRRARAAVPVLAVASELSRLPVRSTSFTCVTASFVLNHLSNPVTELAEMSRVLQPGGRVGVTSWAVGPSDNEIGRAWAETANLFLDQAVIAEEVLQGLPGEKRFADPDVLGEVLSSAGFLVRGVTQKEFQVRISAENYLASRSIAMTARLMRSRLSDASCRRFFSTVADRIGQRFGQRLEFTVRVNFAVGAKGAAGSSRRRHEA